MLASPDSRSCMDAIYKSSRGGGAPHRPEELHTDDLLVFWAALQSKSACDRYCVAFDILAFWPSVTRKCDPKHFNFQGVQASRYEMLVLVSHEKTAATCMLAAVLHFD